MSAGAAYAWRRTRATLLARLFQYRFQNGRGLKGHSFGNLFLTALTNITGDFHEAVLLVKLAGGLLCLVLGGCGIRGTDQQY